MMSLLPELVFWLTTAFLAVASYFDLKTGEIPEKISRSLIVLMLAMAAAQTFFSMQASYLIYSAVIGIGFFLVGYLMFYLGEWGGGDVKILAGIGCSLGILGAAGHFIRLQGIFPYYLDYFINFALAATPYIIVYTFALGLLKPIVFRSFSKGLTGKKSLILLIISFLPAVISMTLKMPNLTLVYLLVPLLVILTFYLKAVEEMALQKMIPVSGLREEDILASDLMVDGKRIAGRRDAGGLSKKQLTEIMAAASERKIPQEITIRWGIRFIPVFFLAYLLTYFVGGALELAVAYFMA
jgi:hypothetical protein